MSSEDFTAGKWSLYDELVAQYKNAPPLQQNEMSAMPLLLKTLDTDGLRIVGLLIRAYGEDKCNTSVPFEGSQSNEDSSAKFDMRKFDPCLQRMLIHFAMIHNKPTTE
jgi:hypothetical protein